MGSGTKVLKRIRHNVAELSQEFGRHLDRFDSIQLFTGPSQYFHQKTISRRRSHTSIAAVLQDEIFLDHLYATLTAWGLHRMGPGNTKLRDIDEIANSLRSQTKALEVLAPLHITSLTRQETPRVASAIWSVIGSLEISIAEARIVANSKALHHLLPDLVPPIDRQYTFNLFYARNMLSIAEEDAFMEMYIPLCEVATRKASVIRDRIGSRWHTSESKVIDNAIVGYMLAARTSASV